MLKTLHKNDTQVTSFIVTKNWNLSNVNNDDLVVMEHTGSPGLPVGLEYIEYTPQQPITSSNCDIALEQQEDDLATFNDGLKTEGLFYPDTDPQNNDGTYKRLIYSQIYNTFYNQYRDPTKIWGLENLDFELSNTKRFISDEFTVIYIPQIVFGEKIIENTFVLYNTTTDNNYTIVDDGNCNLFAGTNLFSHQQEVGEYPNNFVATSSTYCNFYSSISQPSQPVMTLQYNVCFPPSITISWNQNNFLVENYIISKSIDGITYNQYFIVPGNSLSYVDTNITYSNTYWYQMFAENLFGTSSTTPTQSIFATPIFWNTDDDDWDSNTCRNTTWNIE